MITFPSGVNNCNENWYGAVLQNFTVGISKPLMCNYEVADVATFVTRIYVTFPCELKVSQQANELRLNLCKTSVNNIFNFKKVVGLHFKL